MAKHLHANNDDFARCYYDDPTTIHLVIANPDDYFGQVHKVFDVPRATHNGPGRHRWDWEDSLDNNPVAVYFIYPIRNSMTGTLLNPSIAGKFECPREWVDGIAVEFEYL